MAKNIYDKIVEAHIVHEEPGQEGQRRPDCPSG